MKIDSSSPAAHLLNKLAPRISSTVSFRPARGAAILAISLRSNSGAILCGDLIETSLRGAGCSKSSLRAAREPLPEQRLGVISRGTPVHARLRPAAWCILTNLCRSVPVNG